jgi:hypothetical protein
VARTAKQPTPQLIDQPRPTTVAEAVSQAWAIRCEVYRRLDALLKEQLRHTIYQVKLSKDIAELTALLNFTDEKFQGYPLPQPKEDDE